MSEEGVAQRGTAATKLVGASGAGPGPNAVRPYEVRENSCQKNKNLRYCNADLRLLQVCGFKNSRREKPQTSKSTKAALVSLLADRLATR